MDKVKESSSLERMIQYQIVDRGIRDPRVIEAMRGVPRDKFFPANSRDAAFADRAAPIGHGQTISQPYIVALMSQRLDLQPNHRVLDVGTGSGYQAAVLARLAGEVYTIERVKPLLDEAWECLMGLSIRNVHFRHGDGSKGWPDAAPFDRILIGAVRTIYRANCFWTSFPMADWPSFPSARPISRCWSKCAAMATSY